MTKIKILHIIGGSMRRGGTEMFIMNYYRHMNHDLIQFDFVQQGKDKGIFDDELISYGSKIYYVPDKFSHPIQFSKKLYEIYESGEYSIVHSEMDAMGTWPLLIAMFCHIPIRIAHSHNTQVQSHNKIKILINYFSKKALPFVSTDFFACGEKAGIWLFGRKRVLQNKVQIINNAIEINKFRFNDAMRKAIRTKLGIDNKLVIGHIGRFNEQKNHHFLIEIFNELHKKNENSCLLLVGDGELKTATEEFVHSLNLDDSVIFLGEIDNAFEIYNAIDLFLLPSKFEGLAIVLIEAQTNGVQCLVSDTVPTGKLTLNYQICSLNDSPEKWAEVIVNMDIKHDVTAYSRMSELGYNIDDQAKRLERIYLKLYERQERVK